MTIAFTIIIVFTLFMTKGSYVRVTRSRETMYGHMMPWRQNTEIMVVKIESRTDSRRRILTMSFPKRISVLIFSLTLISDFYVAVSSDGLNSNILAAADKLEGFSSLNPPDAASNSTVFKVARDSVLTLNLMSSLPENPEISVYCRNLLGIFGQRYAASVDCFVPAARPVKVCQNCFSAYGSLVDVYMNISDQVRRK